MFNFELRVRMRRLLKVQESFFLIQVRPSIDNFSNLRRFQLELIEMIHKEILRRNFKIEKRFMNEICVSLANTKMLFFSRIYE